VRPASLGVLAGALACNSPAGKTVESANPAGDSGDPTCGEAELWDGVACVPEGCGAFPWGGQEHQDALYVDVTAASGGDGSQDAPFGTLSAALEASLTDGQRRIVLAAGTYADRVEIGQDLDGLSIVGRCPELAVLTVSGDSDSTDAVLSFNGSSESFALAQLTVSGGPAGGVYTRAGSLTLERVWLEDNAGFGLRVTGRSSNVETEQLRVTGTSVDDRGSGQGVYLEAGSWQGADTTLTHNAGGAAFLESPAQASLTGLESQGNGAEAGAGIGGVRTYARSFSCSDCTFRGDHGSAVTAVDRGSTLILDRATFEGEAVGSYAVQVLAGATATWTEGSIRDYSGAGLVVVDSTMTALDLDIAQVQGVGVAVADSGMLTLDGGSIETIRPQADAIIGAGCWIDGGTLDATDLQVHDIHGNGVEVSGGGQATLAGASIADIAHPDGSLGPSGVLVSQGATLNATATTLARVAGNGIHVYGSDSTADLQDVVLTDVGHATDRGSGGGVFALSGAEVTATSVSAFDSVGVAFGAYGGQMSLLGVLVDGVAPGVAVLGTDATAGPGLFVSEGGRLTVVGGVVRQANGVAVAADTHGRLDATDLSVGQTHPFTPPETTDAWDVRVLGGATLSALRLQANSEDAAGIGLSGSGSRAILEDLHLGRSSGPGVVLAADTTLRLSGAELTGRGRAGLLVSGTGATASLSDVHVDGTQDGGQLEHGVGMAAMIGAVVSARELTVTATDGPGVVVQEASLDCGDCNVDDSVLIGLAVLSADVSWQGGAVTGTHAVPGVGGFGVWAEDDAGPAHLLLEDATVAGHDTIGIWLRGQGSYELNRSIVRGGPAWSLTPSFEVHGDALVLSEGTLPWDGHSGVKLSDTLLADAGGAGVLADGAAASFTGVTFTGNTVDAVIQGCDRAPDTVDSLAGAATVEACSGEDRVVLDPDVSVLSDVGGVSSE